LVLNPDHQVQKSRPQYKNFRCTDLEPAADKELRVSQAIGRLFIDTAREFPARKANLSDDDFEYFITHFWCLLHGFVAGYNNSVLKYIHPDPLAIKDRYAAPDC